MTSRKTETKQSFTWDPETTPAPIAGALKELSRTYPLLKGTKGAARLIFKQGREPEKCSVRKDGKDYVIEYGKPNMALRMVGSLLSGVVPEKEEYCPFDMFGIMLDCSRNAVMTVEQMKKYFARLALFGYNMVMLYTEDTYEVGGEPFFGFMRGALTGDEIREMDEYCATLGIEMIPCIQTLGHLEQILRWGAFHEVTDTSRVLLVDEQKTYDLIEKMLLTWKNSVKSRRIHVGMDETHDIGRGRFYDLHGDERHFDIFNRHLGKVVELCKKHGMTPMIWSDMYFRMGSKNNDYYDKNSVIPSDVVKKIPKAAELVYWDYYHEDKAFYLDWIDRHRKLGHEPLMGSGVWTWNMFWYNRQITEKTVVPCVEACREAKVKEVFFTMWGDDGGFCDFDSAFGGLAFASELSFTGKVCNKTLNAKFNALLDGASYDDVLAASEIEKTGPAAALWDDPLMMMHLGGAWFRAKDEKDPYFKDAVKILKNAVKVLSAAPKKGSAGDLKHARLLAEAVLAKYQLTDAVLSAYLKKNNRKALKEVLPLIADYERKFKAFTASFRAMWLRHNKVFGLETMQIRFAGQLARLKELECRLGDFIDGKIDSVPEFDELLKVRGKVHVWGYMGISHATTIR